MITKNEILGELGRRSKELLIEAAGMPQSEQKAAILSEALRHSIAGFFLYEATTEQMIEVWTRFRKPESN